MDGRRGIPAVFKKYIVQLCQLHFQQAILRKTTQRPKSELGMLLKLAVKQFIKERWSRELFTEIYDYLSINYKAYLDEKNEQENYTHKEMRAAMRSIKTASLYLFSNLDYPQLNIPNTTNRIDGGVNPKLKELVRNHRGMNLQRRDKLIQVLLASLGKK